MLSRLLLVFSLFFALASGAQEQSVEVLIKKEALVSADPKVKLPVLNMLTIAGYRQAITKELLERKLDSEKFWKKIAEKNLSDEQEVEFLKPLFVSVALLSAPDKAEDPFVRSVFSYQIDNSRANALFEQILSDMPDVSIKTFYILPEISIDQQMSWSDVGVTKKENFSGVIIESWKKWAATQFKNYSNVVVLEKDFTDKPESMNSESVTLKWNSMLKKSEVFQDRKSARFELMAQYVLVNSKSNQTLIGFDFPTQKREYGIYNPKELSSNLASLVFNLLNSQTAKINGVLESSREASQLTQVDIQIVGKHGLFDVTLVNNFLSEHFKDLTLSSELKSYSGERSVVSLKSTATAEILYAKLAQSGGKWALNEQKILLFSPSEKTFAIIAKEANN